MHGKSPPPYIPHVKGEALVPTVENTLLARGSMICLLKENLYQAQYQMQQIANREFKEGDMAYLHLQPIPGHKAYW